MRVLVVDGFTTPPTDASVGNRVVALLESKGNQVDYLSLAGPEFEGFMSAAERGAYETEQPLLDDTMKSSADRVRSAEAIVFVYPTVLFGPPPVLKSWLERVMVLGVAFVFDDQQRVKPGLTNVRRLGAVTTTPHSNARSRKARDLGYRIFMRTMRLNCHPLCRRTFVRLAADAPMGRVDDRLARSFRSWTA